jgi:hypothetical protein
MSDEKFEELERRIAYLENLVAQFRKPGTDKKDPLADIPKINNESWSTYKGVVKGFRFEEKAAPSDKE